MIYFILIAVYSLSAVLMWRYFHLAYNKGGIDEDSSPEMIDVVITLFPIVNTAFVLVSWIGYYPIIGKHPIKRKFDFSRFFGVKKFLLLFLAFSAISCYEDDTKPIEKYYGKGYVVTRIPDRWAEPSWIWINVKSTDTLLTICLHPFDAKDLKVGDTLNPKIK